VSPALVTIVSVASIVTFMAVAQIVRARAIQRRAASVATSRGFEHYIAYFVFVPYVVIALRPGPELAVPEPLRWIGLGLVLGGVAFAIWAILTLGRHYDLELEVHADHELVDSGPYRLVRHPVYSGLGAHFAGACLATGDLVLIAGTLLVSYPSFYLRARAEERLLRQRFGAAYDGYAKRVGMLVPLL